MTPINVEVTRSKVKVTVAFYAKTISAQYIEKFMTVILLGRKIGHGQFMTPINVKVSRSNVKVTVAFYAKTVSTQYIEQFMNDCHSTW